MNTTVFKYPLATGGGGTGAFDLTLPVHWAPSMVAMQGDIPHLWAIVRRDAEVRPYRFQISYTGESVADDARHCGSWVNGQKVYHLWLL